MASGVPSTVPHSRAASARSRGKGEGLGKSPACKVHFLVCKAGIRTPQWGSWEDAVKHPALSPEPLTTHHSAALFLRGTCSVLCQTRCGRWEDLGSVHVLGLGRWPV